MKSLPKALRPIFLLTLITIAIAFVALQIEIAFPPAPGIYSTFTPLTKLAPDNLGSYDVIMFNDLLTEATTSSDADNSKPAPDIVEAALNKLNIEAKQVVMLADTPYDIESANKAGVEVIAFRCGGFDDSQLKDAIAIYDDPADLLANYDISPFAKHEQFAIESL